MPNDKGGLTPRAEDFPRWYQEVVAGAEMAENGPVRGTMVIRPWGFGIWERLQAELDRRIKEAGRRERLLPAVHPRVVPAARGRATSRGSAPSWPWSPTAAARLLEEPVVVRPTSETVINHFFAKWIQSHRDLPAAHQPVVQRGPLGAADPPVPPHDRVPLAGGPHRARDRGRGDRLRAADPARRLPRHRWRQVVGHPGPARPQDRARALRRGDPHLDVARR